eukprot:scaffold4482_cov14-Tisochrysis_lutea.AAC.1
MNAVFTAEQRAAALLTVNKVMDGCSKALYRTPASLMQWLSDHFCIRIQNPRAPRASTTGRSLLAHEGQKFDMQALLWVHCKMHDGPRTCGKMQKGKHVLAPHKGFGPDLQALVCLRCKMRERPFVCDHSRMHMCCVVIPCRHAEDVISRLCFGCVARDVHEGDGTCSSFLRKTVQKEECARMLHAGRGPDRQVPCAPAVPVSAVPPAAVRARSSGAGACTAWTFCLLRAHKCTTTSAVSSVWPVLGV